MFNSRIIFDYKQQLPLMWAQQPKGNNSLYFLVLCDYKFKSNEIPFSQKYFLCKLEVSNIQWFVFILWGSLLLFFYNTNISRYFSLLLIFCFEKIYIVFSCYEIIEKLFHITFIQYLLYNIGRDFCFHFS